MPIYNVSLEEVEGTEWLYEKIGTVSYLLTVNHHFMLLQILLWRSQEVRMMALSWWNQSLISISIFWGHLHDIILYLKVVIWQGPYAHSICSFVAYPATNIYVSLHVYSGLYFLLIFSIHFQIVCLICICYPFLSATEVKISWTGASVLYVGSC